jgi:hypothetical protein
MKRSLVSLSPFPPQRGESWDGRVAFTAFASLTPPTLPSPARGEELSLSFVECLGNGLEPHHLT